jgi:ketosteroid isomerase-like protein
MTISEPLDIVRYSCDAAARGDLEQAVSVLHSDAEIVDTDIPDAGSYRGHDGYARWVAHWGESWSGWSMEDLDYAEAPDRRVLVLTRGDALVCTVRDGKIARIVYYNDQDRARAEAGLG